MSSKYTVQYCNEALQSSRFCGTFDSEDAARVWAQWRADRGRKFVLYIVYTGSPERPGIQVGEPIRGTK